MTPGKRRPVLYEVVNRSRRMRSRGFGWRMLGGRTEPASGDDAQPVASSEAVAPRRAAWRRGLERTWQLTFGWPHLAGTAVLVCALALGFFQLGKSYGRRQAGAATQPAKTSDLAGVVNAPLSRTPPPEPNARHRAAGQKPPRADDLPVAPGGTRPPEPAVPPVAAKGAEPAPPPPEEPPPPGVLRSGAWYVVVQHFRLRDRAAADQAREFLRGKGIDCVVQRGQGDLMLIATQPFETEPQAKELQRRVRDLGKEYFPVGRYDFKDCETRKF